MQVNSHPVSEEELMAYLDGELPLAIAAETSAHLERCGVCQDVAADLQRVSLRLYAWNSESPGAELSQRILAELDSSLETRERPRRSVWDWFRTHRVSVSLATAALFVVLIVATSKRGVVTVRKYAAALPPDAQSSAGLVDGTLGRLESSASQAKLQSAAPTGPLIVRTAELTLTANDFASVRPNLERILNVYQGHIAQLNINTPTGQPRSLHATVRIPATQLDPALTDLRKLGHVDDESQRGEEVTQRYVDIDARLTNSRNTEQRLTDILRNRTGKLSDVLAVEEQLDNVRGRIETTEAEQKSLANQIAFATVELRILEDYQRPLAMEHAGGSTRLRNAAVEGLQTMVDGSITLVVWLLSIGPSVLLIAAIAALGFFPARFLWKRRRPD